MQKRELFNAIEQLTRLHRDVNYFDSVYNGNRNPRARISLSSVLDEAIAKRERDERTRKYHRLIRKLPESFAVDDLINYRKAMLRELKNDGYLNSLSGYDFVERFKEVHSYWIFNRISHYEKIVFFGGVEKHIQDMEMQRSFLEMMSGVSFPIFNDTVRNSHAAYMSLLGKLPSSFTLDDMLAYRIYLIDKHADKGKISGGREQICLDI
ncbi:MAG: hypothetical protein AABW41_04370 [Nanoarchaeota archaeon]